MEIVQIELPPLLAQRLRQEVSHKALSQVVTEALQFWLEKKSAERSDNNQIQQALERAGLVMTSERQREFARSLLNKLPFPRASTRAKVEAALANLKVPLSEEILSMRGER
jgi:hypothetical protein